MQIEAAAATAATVGMPLFQVEADRARTGHALITVGYNTMPGEQQRISLAERDLPHLNWVIASYMAKAGIPSDAK
jgi:hypothetical protein